MTSSLSEHHRKWMLVAFKVAVVALVTWAISDTLNQAIEQLKNYSWQFNAGWLVLCGVLYLAGLVPAALYWHRLLHALGGRASLFATMRAYLIGHLGKYMPGKALVVVLRVALLRDSNVNAATAGVSVFLETLAMMSVGAGVAGLILALWYPDQWYFILIALSLFVAAGLPTMPPVTRRLLMWLRIKRFQPEIVEQLDRVKPQVFLTGWAGLVVGWVVLGVSLWACLRGLGIDEPFWRNLPLYTACVALAMVAGFLSLIPGGAGIRELVLTQLLAKQSGIDDGEALLAAVLLRVVWLLSELIVSAILYVGGRSPRNDSQDAAS